jgi:hypothetical protein
LNLLPSRYSYVAYGTDMLVQNPAYLDAMVGMVQDIFSDEKVGGAAEKLIGLQNRLNLFEPLTFEIQLSASLERLVNKTFKAGAELYLEGKRFK